MLPTAWELLLERMPLLEFLAPWRFGSPSACSISSSTPLARCWHAFLATVKQHERREVDFGRCWSGWYAHQKYRGGICGPGSAREPVLVAAWQRKIEARSGPGGEAKEPHLVTDLGTFQESEDGSCDVLIAFGKAFCLWRPGRTQDPAGSQDQGPETGRSSPLFQDQQIDC